jgi:hypothetical protein
LADIDVVERALFLYYPHIKVAVTEVSKHVAAANRSLAVRCAHRSL